MHSFIMQVKSMLSYQLKQCYKHTQTRPYHGILENIMAKEHLVATFDNDNIDTISYLSDQISVVIAHISLYYDENQVDNLE